MQITKEDHLINKEVILALTAIAAAFVLLTMMQDSFYAKFSKFSFYFSESFIFSAFWWIFIPFLYGHYAMVHVNKPKSGVFKIVLVTFPVILHLIAFPALVWLLSRLFYYHTFRFQQTFQYSLSVHLYQLFFFYTVPVLVYQYFREKIKTSQPVTKPQTNDVETIFKTTFVVSEGSKKISIAVADILYFSASSPYINIHYRNKKYLYNESLKSVSDKIDRTVFVRVHKSTIVNIEKVESYTSRLNGDYDVTMQDGIQLRVSRNYATVFKATFQQGHRVTVKYPHVAAFKLLINSLALNFVQNVFYDN